MDMCKFDKSVIQELLETSWSRNAAEKRTMVMMDNRLLLHNVKGTRKDKKRAEFYFNSLNVSHKNLDISVLWKMKELHMIFTFFFVVIIINVFLLLLLPCTVLEECISVLPRCAT
jgi:hypothetical protein